MKTTVEVPDDLYRRVKSEAALRGVKVRDLVEKGLRLALEKPSKGDLRQNVAEAPGIGSGGDGPRFADAPPAPVKRRIDADTERAARAFLKRLGARYAVIEAFVFGSRARGTHRGDSDADVAVILSGKAGSRFKVAGDMAGIAFDVMQETGVLVDPLPIWEDEMTEPVMIGNPSLIETIKREGFRL